MADALAVDEADNLFVFEVNGSNSRLLSVDPVSAEASVIGEFLPNREIRGAVIDFSGRLLVVDNQQGEFFEVNMETGAIEGTPLSFTYNREPFHPTLLYQCDLAHAPNGDIHLSVARSIYKLDVRSGELTLVHTDLGSGQEGWEDIAIMGLAYAWAECGGNLLYALDAHRQEDIYSLDSRCSYGRVTVFANIIPSFNSGGADLASYPGMATNMPPRLISQPVNVAALVGDSVQFEVVARGEGPIQYQWFYNETPLNGETGQSLGLSNVGTIDSGSFAVAVSNPHGWTTSRPASLEVAGIPRTLIRTSLSWPEVLSRAGFLLEEAESLGADWSHSSLVPGIVDTNCVIFLDRKVKQKLYRLRRP